jgi:hypothetical protein
VASENRDSGFCNARNLRPVKSRSRDPRSHERRGDVVEWGLQSEWRTGGMQLGFCVARDARHHNLRFPDRENLR